MIMKSAAHAAILSSLWACSSTPVATAAAASASASASNGNGYANGNGNPGIVTFPLLSHQHVVQRHLAELSSTPDGRRLLAAHNLTSSSFDRLPFHRPRSLSSPSQQLSPLYQGYGTHYLDLWLGLPTPQRQTAVVDTGSSATAFPCLECRDCGTHADPPFNETASESFRISVCPSEPCAFGSCDVKGTCLVAHEYGSGDDASSWIAFEAQDVVYAGGSHDRPLSPDDASANAGDPRGELPATAPLFSFPLTFGCQTSTTGYFRKQLASGVVGLDRKAQSFWGQMRASQIIHRAQFSLCFVRQPVASFSGTGAGAVSFGGADPRLHATPMVFAKAMGHGSTASFKVRVRKMYLGENGGGSGAESVMYDAASTVYKLDLEEESLNGKEEFNFDSGTTDTYFTKGLSDEFRRVWREITKREYTNDEVALSDAELRKLPTVFLQMIPHEGGVGDEFVADDPRAVPGLAGKVDVGLPNDVLFAIPPTHYMQEGAKQGVYASRIYLDRDDDMGSVLGSNAMMGYDILFDMDAARIGFAESDCDYLKVVKAAEDEAAREADGADAQSVGAAASAEGSIIEAEDDSSGICGTLKCRGFFGLTLTIVFILFFIFARRYITRRDDGIKSGNTASSSRTSEYEMKSSGTSATSRYSDDEIHLSGGERGGYHDTAPPPPRYSDRRRDSDGGDRDGGYRISGDRSSSSRSHYSHSSSSSRRDYGLPRSDGSHRSQESYHSTRSGSSSGRPHGENRNYGGDRSYSGSVQSHHSTRSQRSAGSHHSTRSQRSTGSHRSTSSRDSHRSHSSHRSSSSRDSRRSSHDRGGSASGSSRRYRDDYDDDEIPMPPTIS